MLPKTTRITYNWDCSIKFNGYFYFPRCTSISHIPYNLTSLIPQRWDKSPGVGVEFPRWESSRAVIVKCIYTYMYIFALSPINDVFGRRRAIAVRQLRFAWASGFSLGMDASGGVSHALSRAFCGRSCVKQPLCQIWPWCSISIPIHTFVLKFDRWRWIEKVHIFLRASIRHRHRYTDYIRSHVSVVALEDFAALQSTEPEKRGRKSRFPTRKRPSAILDGWK